MSSKIEKSVLGFLGGFAAAAAADGGKAENVYPQ